jgi:hypothetical protein
MFEKPYVTLQFHFFEKKNSLNHFCLFIFNMFEMSFNL